MSLFSKFSFQFRPSKGSNKFHLFWYAAIKELNPDPGKIPDLKGPDPYLTCVKCSPRLSMNQYLYIMRDIA
jgi:hypothetical protein